jgi:hypothetical protein
LLSRILDRVINAPNLIHQTQLAWHLDLTKPVPEQSVLPFVSAVSGTVPLC